MAIAMSRSNGPVVVLGSVNMDLIGTTDHFPQPGETVLGTQFSMVPGGKGGNQAIAAARAGGPVQFIGAVGDDEYSRTLRRHLSDADVGIDSLRTVPGPSGVALITVDQRGENTIVVLPGANATLDQLTTGDQEIIASASILVCQLEIPLSAVTAAALIAQAAGVPVLLNPSPAMPLPADLLAAVTIAVVNHGEARIVGEQALALIPHVVTTLGAEGATDRAPDGSEIKVASPPVDVVDTTGAGDAFTGALAVSWARGDDPPIALRRACAAGALATTVRGAGAPSAAAIDELVRRTSPA